MKTSFIPSPSHRNPISQPKPTIRFGMNQPKKAMLPAGDTVSFHTPQANLSQKQLQSRWDKLAQALRSSKRAMPESEKLAVVQGIVPQIPTAQCLQFLTKTSDFGETILHCAARIGNASVMGCLLESLQELEPDPAKRLVCLTKADASGHTVLHEAARFGNAAVMKYLLESLNKLVPDPAIRLAFLKQTDQYGYTALQKAIRFKNIYNAALLEDTEIALSWATRLKEIDNATRSLKFTDEQPTAATQWVTNPPNICQKIDKKQNENAK